MIEINVQGQWYPAAGTIIGSRRCHDVIPWDGDLDVFMDLKYRNLAEIALKRLTPEIGFYGLPYYNKLFFSAPPSSDIFNPNTTGSFNLTSYHWSWPLLDIFHYKHPNDMHLFKSLWGTYFIKKSDVFPLGRNWYPTPRRPSLSSGCTIDPIRALC